MIRNVLVALDGSPSSSEAVRLGLRLAAEHSLKLTGLAVLDEPAILSGEPVPLGGGAFKARRDEALLEDAAARIQAFLKEFAQTCQSKGVDCDTLEARGEPCEEIDLESRRHDLILLSRETHFHFETRETETDVFRELARSASRPILAAPRALPAVNGPGGQGVLIAYDDSPSAARALQMFHNAGLWPGREITLVSVHEDDAEALACGLRGVQFLENHGWEVIHLPIHSESEPSEIILETEERLKPELLVMGAHGSKGLMARLYGSTTQKLLTAERDHATPIFIYH